VRWWSVGNETYGNWEIGHCSAPEYADRYVEFCRAMRAVDPSIRIVAVGCGGLGPEGSDAGWNRTVLERAGEDVEALSVHFYFPGPGLGRALRDDEADYLQVATGADELGVMLDRVIAGADQAGRPRAVPISLDEWNLWADWRELITTNHRLGDAVFFAGCYNRILERADRVTMAMISQQVNCMAPIQTRCDRSFGTAAFLVGMLYRRAARAGIAATRIECDTLVAPAFDVVDSDSVPMTGERTAFSVDASATHDAGGTAVFLANRRIDGAVQVTVCGLPPGARGRLRHLVAEDDHPFARNDEDTPDALGFRDVPVAVGDDGRATVELPPHTAGVVQVRP
jgi:alpha-N-arabinofuranosidase